MSTKLCKKSPFEYIRKFVRCGNLNCSLSCDSDCLTCLICSKSFHFNCVKISKKQYTAALTFGKEFVCSKKCYNLALPFSNIDNIDFLCTLFGENSFPCKKCKRDCIGNGLMDCIQCDICLKWQHSTCANLPYSFETYTHSSYGYVCSKRCEMSLFPFNRILNNEQN